MRALSIRQPYAWLIVAGLKEIENRLRRLSYRGPLLIHAGRQLADIELDELERCFRVEIPQHALKFGGIIGMVDVIDCVNTHPSPWFER